ncbi:MAG: HEAT repeat domain-containing protein [Planctomycetes bacterium]|nr:HEAT repeat domain-containing protein [Planctomycetota bacterium]
MNRFLGLVLSLVVAIPCLADGPSREEVQALAAKVGDYPTKFRLIEIGVPAIAPLLEQTASSDPWLALESKTTVRWIAERAAANPKDSRVVAEAIAAFTTADKPASSRLAAAELLGHAGTAVAVEALGKLLGEEPLRDVALTSLRRISGADAESVVREGLRRAPRAAVPAWLRTLGRSRDPRFTPLLLSAMEDPATREAAFEALGASGDPAAAPPLVAFLKRGGTVDDKRGAFAALVCIAQSPLRAADVSEIYADALMVAPDDAGRIVALDGLGKGANEAALPLVESAAKSPNDDVKAAAHRALAAIADDRARRKNLAGAASLYARVAAEARDEVALVRAMAGLGGIGSADEVADIAKHLNDPSRRVAEAAIGALVDIPDTRATMALVGELGGRCRPLVLDALARRGDPAALPALKALAEKDVVDAIPVLGAIGDPSVADFLLGRAAQHNQAALTAYLKIVTATATRDPATARKLCERLLEKVPCAAGITALEGVADASSSLIVQKLFDVPDEDVKAAAVHCLVTIADRAVASADRELALRLYRVALDRNAPGLEDKLRDLGEQIEVTARDGRVSAWWVIGPFAAPNAASWEKPEFPEKGVDLAKSTKIGDRDCRWRSVAGAGDAAEVDLAAVLDPHENVAAYAYCELVSKREREVTFHGGSDDGMIVWVNGERVHAFLGPRGLKPDEDTFKAKLKEGSNTILVKALQIGGGWAFCLRADDEEGLPLKFKMR